MMLLTFIPILMFYFEYLVKILDNLIFAMFIFSHKNNKLVFLALQKLTIDFQFRLFLFIYVFELLHQFVSVILELF